MSREILKLLYLLENPMKGKKEFISRIRLYEYILVSFGSLLTFTIFTLSVAFVVPSMRKNS